MVSKWAYMVFELWDQTMGPQIAPSRDYLHTLGPKVSILYILGALGIASTVDRDLGCRVGN